MMGKNPQIEKWSAKALMEHCLEKGRFASDVEFAGREILITGKIKGRGLYPFTFELEAETQSNHFIVCIFEPEAYPEIWKFHISEKVQIAGRYYSATFGMAYNVIVLEQCKFMWSAGDLADEVLRDYNRRHETAAAADDHKSDPPSLLRQLEDRYLSEPKKEPEPEAVDPRLLALSNRDPN